ncbi:epimerase [Leifsonia xyli subsp. xyli]|nr:NAD-dependent epimerase/dehydratase family protein [Leifsonia xyli]ODA90314.1 epimerase [Leifsonia xyli subsp. xyli]
MKILLTGATGYIGSSVLPCLLAEGHSVTALVRDEAKTAAVRAAGADAIVGDAADAALVEDAARASDGVVHLASTKEADPVLVPAVLAGLAGSGKPFVHTGGIWTYGDAADIAEESPSAPPALTVWRGATEALVLAADGVRGIVVAPSIVYGRGGGLARLLADAPRGSATAPALRLIGDGSQHWATVHVDDLAAVYALALENGGAGEIYIGASGANPTVRELGIAAADAAGLAGRVEEESAAETADRLGGALAEALLLSQSARGTKARITLSWEPNGPSLIDELTSGSYAPAAGRGRSGTFGPRIGRC